MGVDSTSDIHSPLCLLEGFGKMNFTDAPLFEIVCVLALNFLFSRELSGNFQSQCNISHEDTEYLILETCRKYERSMNQNMTLVLQDGVTVPPPLDSIDDGKNYTLRKYEILLPASTHFCFSAQWEPFLVGSVVILWIAIHFTMMYFLLKKREEFKQPRLLIK